MNRRNKAKLTSSFSAELNKAPTGPFIFNLQSSPKTGFFSKGSLSEKWRGSPDRGAIIPWDPSEKHDSCQGCWEGLAEHTPELLFTAPVLKCIVVTE